MMKIHKVCAAALRKIKPGLAERRAMRRFQDELLAVARTLAKPYAAKPMLCGSIAKGTWLSQRPELDLFILFSPGLSRERLERFGLALAKDIMTELRGSYRIAYAEHPYLTGQVTRDRVYKIDIVPCYDIANPAKIISAVDRTPHHVRYIKAHLRLPDAARLLKAFAMAADCYGADTKTQGFSGYLCELLVLNYGRFASCIRAIAGWRAGTAIDLMAPVNAKKLLAKFHAPLIVLDPIDRNRNVAAAVSAETFHRFVRAARDFLAAPSLQAFFPAKKKPYAVREIMKEIRARGTRWYLISFRRPDIIDDILWPQMRRCLAILKILLEQEGFELLRSGCWANKEHVVLCLEMKEWLLPRIAKTVGPNIYSRHAVDFLKHYREHRVFIEGENWVVELPRAHISTLFFLKNLLAKPEPELLAKGIPSKLAKPIRKAEIAAGGDAFKAMQRLPADFRVFIRDWFERDLNIVD